jgi:uncharacterized protein (DUF697 family)
MNMETTSPNPRESEALLTLALMAAFADGNKDESERAELKRIAATLPGGDTSPLYQRVLLRQVSMSETAAALPTPALRQLGYEMAVCVCDADDRLNEGEKKFLADLRKELRLDAAAASDFEAQADTLTSSALIAPPVIAAGAAFAPAADPGKDAEVDKMVLNYAILNGALELLPESLSTMAIVPLQMKMVYSVGKQYGFELDRRHIVELLGAAGVGLTSQVVEGYARKLLGGLFGKLGGGLGRTVGHQVASSAMSFASTYALGQLAQKYYAGGRRLSSSQLREQFGNLTEQAKSLHGRYAGQIQERARSLNPTQILNLVRGQMR